MPIPEQAGNPLIQLFPLLVVFMIFYFLVFKPEKDKQNRHRKQISDLKKNDLVVTVGGIHGTVVNVKPTTLVIRIDDSVKIEVDKEAIKTIKDSKDNKDVKNEG
jgi:preprotein translocase subunit YajC